MRGLRILGLLGCLALVSETSPVEAQKPRRPREPVVQGKTISEWATALGQKDVVAQVQAINALGRAGPEARKAAPALVALLRNPGAPFLPPLIAVGLSRIGTDAVPELRKALQDANPEVRSRAAHSLGLIGPTARAAVADLSRGLKDSARPVRQASAEALGQLGRDARSAGPALRMALEDPDPLVRLQAAAALWRISRDDRGVAVLGRILGSDRDAAQEALQILAEIGPPAKPALEAIRIALADKDPLFQITAAQTLARVGGDPASALAVLERSLDSPTTSLDEKRAAISGLGACLPNRQAVELLLRQRRERDPVLRLEATSAATEGDANLPSVSNLHVQGMKDAEPTVRWWAALGLASGSAEARKHEESILRAFQWAMMRLPEDADAGKGVVDVQVPRRGVSALVSLLKAGPARIRVAAATSLGTLGFDARPALDDLVAALAEEDKALRRASADTLGTLGNDALDRLVKLPGNPDARVREGAARALGRMGLPARSAVPMLERLLTDSDAPVRTQAALAIWQIDQNTELAIPVLTQVLRDVDNSDRWEAIEAIGTIAMDARPAIRGITEVLVRALEDRDVRVRQTAAKWLWRRTRQAKVVIPLVREGIQDRDVTARLMALETLGEMAGEDRAVPLILPALEDRDLGVRIAVVAALARGGATVVPHLVETLGSGNPRVRLNVLRALGLLGPAAKQAVPAVRKRLSDPVAEVKEAAEEALRGIENRR